MESSAPANYLTRTPDAIVVEVLDMLYATQEDMLRGDFEARRCKSSASFSPRI